MRNDALDQLPRKADDDCLTELRWIYDLRRIGEVHKELAPWVKKWLSQADHRFAIRICSRIIRDQLCPLRQERASAPTRF